MRKKAPHGQFSDKKSLSLLDNEAIFICQLETSPINFPRLNGWLGGQRLTMLIHISGWALASITHKVLVNLKLKHQSLC